MKKSMYAPLWVFIIGICGLSFISCAQSKSNQELMQQEEQVNTKGLEVITLGGGCFWCVEAVYQQMEGVEKVVSGYAGGEVENPSYKAVCSGTTGHAEVIQVYFDPKKITLDEILDIFWHAHDPTTLNRQGNDVGTQYRSIIMYHNEAQRKAAEASKVQTEKDKLWDDPIVTEIVPLDKFYVAENYHQNYYAENKNSNSYCTFVISPKVQKIKKKFAQKLKEGQ